MPPPTCGLEALCFEVVHFSVMCTGYLLNRFAGQVLLAGSPGKVHQWIRLAGLPGGFAWRACPDSGELDKVLKYCIEK